MDSISLVTINGSMFFVKSVLSEDISNKIDKIAHEISNKLISKKEADIFTQFVQTVSEQTNVALEKVEISHVYRINLTYEESS